jgi:serine protease Do
VIVTEDGHIVTNAHVVAGTTRVYVQLSPNRPQSGGSIVRPAGRIMKARLVGLDAETDLALLKVEAQGLPFLALGDSESVRQGQLVVAIGSPAGLDSSVSMGIISAVARQLQPDDRVIYLQTDAPINPGNSGGALVDVDGNLIGVNTMILSQSGGSHGIGFAVPSNIVRFVVDQMRRTGFVLRGDIGVEAQTLTAGLAAGLGLSRDSGVILADVFPGGPGDIAGLKTGDIVLTLNEKPMENARQFHVNLYQQGVASVVRLKVLRAGETLARDVVVLERSNSFERFATLVNDRQHLVPRLSILALPIDRTTVALLPCPSRRPSGVLVARLAVTTTGPRGDLLPGDVIYEVNRQAVTSVAELRAVVDKQEAGEPVTLQVERGGKLRYVEIQLE